MGLFAALLVVIGFRTALGEETFGGFGWRLPFLVSILLLGVSMWIRLQLSESPVFLKMKEEGKTSKAPLTESFAQWKNLKIVILALVGLTAGQAVVWYTGQFQALFFLQTYLKVDPNEVSLMIAASLLIGTPFFVVFGSLSDRIGRKPIIMAGCLIAALTYFPLFNALTKSANPELAAAQAASKVIVTAAPGECSFQGSPVAREIDFKSSCDIAKRYLAQSSVSYDTKEAPAGTPATISIGDKVITAPSATVANSKFDEDSAKKIGAFKKEAGEALKVSGYPTKAKPIAFMSGQWWQIVAILTILVIYVTMVYGPIAAMLVEMFPTRIRYTSMSLPYHIGNGWFGGLLPTTYFAIVASTGNMFSGLWYPIIIASITFVVGVLFVKETKDVDIYRND